MAFVIGGGEFDLCDRSVTHFSTGLQNGNMSVFIFIGLFLKRYSFSPLETPHDDKYHNSIFFNIFGAV